MGIPLTLSSVPSVTPYIQYIATNGQTVFPYPFPITQDADLVCVINGVTQATDSGYTLSGQGNPTGGNLTFTLGRTTSDIVTLFRDVTIERITQIGQNSGFNSTAFNAEFNNIYLILQQLQESILLSLQVPNTNAPAPTTGLTPASYANKYLSFDANGNPTPAILTSTGSVTGAQVAQLLSSVTATPGTADKVRTAAEITANVTPLNYAYQPYDLRRYGADSTGAVACDAALVSAVAVCSASNGGTILLPNGKYTFASPVTVLANKSSIILQGDGSATGGGQPATQIAYSGSGSGIFMDFRSSVGCKIRDCQIVHTNAGYTGTYMKFGNDGSHGDGPFCELSNCVIGSSVGGVGNVHVALDKCICFTAYKCNFVYGNPSITGMASGSYSNVVAFRDCHFYQNYVAPVNTQGQAWTFDGCTFEQLTTGAAGAIAGAAAGTTPAVGLVVKGCWFGDVTNTAPSGTWIDGSISGAEISANYFSGNVTSNNTTAIALRQASGVAIIGNSFGSLNTAINFVTGSCFGIVCEANQANSVGTTYAGTANVPLGQLKFGLGFGFGIPTGHGQIGPSGYRVHHDGSIEQWGFVSPATFGTHAITPFLLAFPTACDNVTLTLSGVVATTATIDVSALTTTGFTYYITDGTTTTDSFYWRAIGR